MSFNLPSQMQVSVSIPLDEKGMAGRECPRCEKVFKVKPGTGLTGKDLPCHCAYCGHVGNSKTFYTKEQIEYAKSVAIRQFTNRLHSELKNLEFDHRPSGPFGFGISLKVKAQPSPIRYYYESRLETDVVCDNCTLSYAIYGEFAFCPDCGSHNSLTILGKNIEFVEKLLALAVGQEPEMANRLVGDGLENLVSAFDGFGREVCKVAASRASKPSDAENVSFQNLLGAQKRVLKLFGFDMSSCVSSENWEFACRSFQKRHLLAHKMGVVDEDYVEATKDRSVVVGRKVSITPEEVTRLGGVIRKFGESLGQHLLAPPPTAEQSLT